MAETKNKGAGIHKTKLDYNDAMLLLEVEGLARDGFDDQQIAEILDVAPQTFSKARNKKKDDGEKSSLSEALTRGRRPLSVLVENALYKRAMGQTVKTTTTTTKTLMLDGKPVTFTDTTVTETELPSDTFASTFWLRNRKPDVYNIQPDRVDITTKGNEIKETPRILKIEHVQIDSDQVKKQDVEV